MLEHAEVALRIAAAKSNEQILDDELAWHALVRVIEVVGEAAGRLPKDARSEYAAIPWSDIVGTRNYLAHGYDTIDAEVLFRILREDIPRLAEALREVLKDFD
jgi:uncharacterized protein with HEPN domain